MGRALARPHRLALGARMRPPACHPPREGNETNKIEEEEAKSTPFRPSPEMSCSPNTFFLFPNVKTKTTNPCFLPHELYLVILWFLLAERG